MTVHAPLALALREVRRARRALCIVDWHEGHLARAGYWHAAARNLPGTSPDNERTNA